jgi:uncharacterized repeat protein (TIGR01451 family)
MPQNSLRLIAIVTAFVFLLLPISPSLAEVSETSSSTPAIIDEISTSTEAANPSPTIATTTEEVAASTTESEIEDEALSGTASTTATTTSEFSTSTTTTTVTIDSDSTADLSNSLLVQAATGNNTASGTATTVVTGAAQASMNVVNVINTSITDSTGFFLLLNNFGANNQTIDFRSLYQPLVPVCGLTCQTNVTVTSTSTATVENNVIARANTGGNSADGTNAAVSTGDAYAGANMVNVVNSNLVDANYMMLVFNNFGDWSGDLVLPGLDFFSDFVGKDTSQVTIDSGTPRATASSSNASIQTGQAVSESTTVTTANQNFIGNDSLVILVRVHGDWSGNLFSLPPGIAWQETNDGVELLGSGDAFANATSATDNSLVMKNDVDVYALTGENEVSNGGHVTTGNAYASSNVVNMVNTNVVGRNWILAIVNIFGDWGGDMAFGRPDLWVGSTADLSDGTIHPGDKVALTYTVTNNGDAPATNVTLAASFDSPLANFVDSAGAIVPQRTIQIGQLAPGESRSVTALAEIDDDLPSGGAALTGSAVVQGRETDNNQLDNTDYLTLVSARRGMGSVVHPPHVTPLEPLDQIPENIEPPVLSINKQVLGSNKILAGSEVDYEVTVTNDGGPAEDAVLTDVLRLPNGDDLTTQTWQLGTIQADEEIVIDYTVAFAPGSPAGVYTNTAQLIAKDSTGATITKSATHDVEITLPPAPSPVLTASAREAASVTDIASSTSDHRDLVALAAASLAAGDGQDILPPAPDMFAASAETSWPIGKGFTILVLLLIASFLATTQYDRVAAVLNLSDE